MGAASLPPDNSPLSFEPFENPAWPTTKRRLNDFRNPVHGFPSFLVPRQPQSWRTGGSPISTLHTNIIHKRKPRHESRPLHSARPAEDPPQHSKPGIHLHGLTSVLWTAS
ncbi:hypothetical protein M407DRAFT_175905 [Tulasnella calospora MUT 4182]|uniref:Uncharacterized protein n=1 Tax=Tulasnella calospora MUT 4182 TaxID=1051891 RepID=A0A0C3L5A0_9AGAM|nr:hypothetical protein M407DRAFT_175905 [Tulasnella calospora MUT 4182]